ncbi:MAG: asparagine synthase (glutamine-hydrolyzing) [Verrucomicrobiales bacterium]
MRMPNGAEAGVAEYGIVLPQAPRFLAVVDDPWPPARVGPMCGIAGIISRGGLPADAEARARRMLGAIRHRGPDQFGLFLGPRAVLGSARLSIIDLAGGQQPIGTVDRRHWIVFNGEIFNYVELRRSMEARGHRFQTQSDTEVLLQLIVAEGPSGLRRLNGQFAFALYDAVAGELFLARDRLGVRPLFFTEHRGAWYFGSEVKSLLSGIGERASLNPEAVGEVFTYWSVLPGRSVFSGIHELPPAHWLRWKEGGTHLERYWDCDFDRESTASAPRPHSAGEWKEELKHRLVEATRIRLRADVPVGAYLSGGLDSSLLAAIVRSSTSTPLRTFSIAFADPRFDEREHQVRMAAHLGTDHEVVEATHADIGHAFPAVVRHTETPILRTAPVPLYLLAQQVRARGFKVVLTGEGADEFLGGYDIFKEAAVRQFWARAPASARRPRLLERLYPDIFPPGTAATGMMKAFFGQGLTEVDSLVYSHAIRWRNAKRLRRFFDPAAGVAEPSPPADVLAPWLPAGFRRWDSLARSQYMEITLFLSHYLLSSQGDRVSMAHSIEGRHPYLDVRLVEWCNHLPSGLKRQGLREKVLLRAVGRDFLPAPICQRLKRPYRAPIARSFFHPSTPEYVGELLSDSALRATGLFLPRAVARLCEKAEAGGDLSETDDMALAGVLSTQLVHHWFAERPPENAPVTDRDDVIIHRDPMMPCADL